MSSLDKLRQAMESATPQSGGEKKNLTAMIAFGNLNSTRVVMVLL